MIRQVKEQLKQLWKNVFGDEDEYLEAYFSQMYDEENTLVYWDGDKIAAALYIIPYDLCYSGRKEKCAYLYALATDSRYRRQGIMSELIHKALEKCRREGYLCCVLIPAEDSLCSYYEKFGFKKGRPVKADYSEELMTLELPYPMEVKECSVSDMLSIYRSSRAYERWGIRLDCRAGEFFLTQLTKEGGHIYSFDMEGEAGYAAVLVEKKTLQIISSNLHGGYVNSFREAMHRLHDFDVVENKRWDYMVCELGQAHVDNISVAGALL